MKYTIISAETDLGVHINGANLGANILSNQFPNYPTIHLPQNKQIIKNTDPKNLQKNLPEINKYNQQLFEQIIKTINNNNFPITIGGDHSLAIATALASNHFHNNLGIIWIDAHADYNTLETTLTGNIHGLPLAAINGHNQKELTNLLTNNYISKENTVIVGARSIDPKELENLKNNNIKVFTTDDIKQQGIQAIMDQAFTIATNNTNGVHISYDLDIIDPHDCPGVSIPEINGITKEEAYQIMDYLVTKKHQIKSLDLVEYNPNYDQDNKSLIIATNLLNKFLN